MLEMARYLSIKTRAALYELRGDQRGLETIEIVLIAALVIVSSIFLWRAIGTGVKDNLTELCKGVMSDAKQGQCNKS